MLNFEMNLKRVNDKYYVNEIEVSKEEYLDAEAVLEDYLTEQKVKDIDDLLKFNNICEMPQIDIFDMELFESTIHKNLLKMLNTLKEGLLISNI